MKSAMKILFTDSIGAILAGVLTILLQDTLSEWYHLSQNTLLFIGVVNLIYGLYSGSIYWSLKQGKDRIKERVSFLILANCVWTGVCFTQTWYLSNVMGVLGYFHLTGEGIYVLALAYLELKFVLPKIESDRTR